MKKIEVNEFEIAVLKKSLKLYTKKLEDKTKELNECSSHFFVNEGLMNEVRIEKEKINGELQIIKDFIAKLKLEDDDE